MHRGLPGGRDRRRAGPDARRGRALVHRLRAVPAALPGGLHRHGGATRPLDRCAQARGGPPRPLEEEKAELRGHRAGEERRRAQAGALGRSPPARPEKTPKRRGEIFARLARANPSPTTELEYGTPFELLVAVVLSAQATDKSVNLATRRLFPSTPQKIADLGVQGLEQYIKSIGLYRTKAKNVVALSEILLKEHGGEVPRSREALERLPGVGRKTANVVLNTAFGEPTVAVDTHIFRVANRTKAKNV